MTEPANDDEPKFELLLKEDGVWMSWKGESRHYLYDLGPFNQAAEIMTAFLAAHDYGE